MWKIYDDLIAAVPNDCVASGILAGLGWFLVRSAGVGISMRPREGEPEIPQAGNLAGKKTRELAAWLKSWNPNEAAIGLAALNSYFNAPRVVEGACGHLLERSSNQSIFLSLLEELRGKRVAVVGHFRGLEHVASVCRLTVLERHPGPGDLPDPACEYILPESEVVIITATTLINKTLPRLLELSRNARVVLAGPSAPLSPILLEYGIDRIGGLIVEDEDWVRRLVSEGGHHRVFDYGSRMVTLAAAQSRPEK